ncbi:glucosamine inositolphosphorylceramide transferase family protein [Saccharicrinis sp. 156]|uniref:glucosamine inositolphosphorylceramide transferase family protein n=1 Tax=Saccharicrinis sp. 156 TaxID=3417574 RepID=UPI003D3291A1
MNIIKVGAFIDDLDRLKNWELRIFNELLNSRDIDFSLLIVDGRKNNKRNFNYSGRKLKFSQIIVIGLSMIQYWIEAFFFKHDSFSNRKETIEKLKSVDRVDLFPKRNGQLDYFDKKDCSLIRDYQLDIVLQHGFNRLEGEVFNVSKFGIWCFHHKDRYNNCVAGVREAISDIPFLNITLLKMNSGINNDTIIDQCAYNKHWSMWKNKSYIYRNSSDVLLKNIRLLKRAPDLRKELQRTIDNRLLIKDFLGYMIKFCFTYFKGRLGKIKSKFSKSKGARWTLMLGQGNFLDTELKKLKPIQLPAGEFWADPFLFYHQGEKYVFFENFPYKDGLGKISCGKLSGGKVVDVVDVLTKDYHLSYPFIFHEGNEIFMIPETNEANRLEIYRCIKFPDQWELYSTAFEGEAIVDTIYYKDTDSQSWLFVNKGDEFFCNLYIYKISSLKLEEISSHSLNPVITDSRTGRNGGAIFRHENKFIRPSQLNIRGVYGYGLNLNVINKLNLENYEEKHLSGIEAGFSEGVRATHHLHQIQDQFVIDVLCDC